MATIDLTPRYRCTIGGHRLGPLLETAWRNDQAAAYPPTISK